MISWIKVKILDLKNLVEHSLILSRTGQLSNYKTKSKSVDPFGGVVLSDHAKQYRLIR